MIRTKLADRIFLVRFRTQYELAATFLRFQEHYESRRFAGRIFSLEQFMDWYAATFGRFTYYEDWSGFNVPSQALEPFYQGRFDPLLEKEKRFLELFEDEHPPFYVLGVTGSASIDDLMHELAHALFTMVPAYRAAVRAAMRGHNTTAVERELSRLGYSRRVMPDEVHAYLIDANGLASAATPRLVPLGARLRTIFRQHRARVLATSAPRGARSRSARRPGRRVSGAATS
jgi:hypothetical protein